jgi:hypothetical protein
MFLLSDCSCTSASAAAAAVTSNHQQVLGTAMVSEDDTGKIPPHSAVAITTINITCGGSLLDNNDNGGGAAPTPVAPGEPGGGVTVTLGDVNTKPVENVVWTLKLSPNGLTGNKVTKLADGSVDLKFDVVHSRSVETVSCLICCYIVALIMSRHAPAVSSG